MKIMGTTWITVKRWYKGSEETSSLSLDSKDPKRLHVVGVLPHTCAIAPRSQEDADRLRDWLNEHFPPRMAEPAWIAAADKLLEKIAGVTGIEPERKALIACMPAVEQAVRASRQKVGVPTIDDKVSALDYPEIHKAGTGHKSDKA